MSSKKTKGAKKRVQRATSNVFAMFDESQIREFKEAFNLTDQNRDGFIDKDDLREMYANLGKDAADSELEKMLSDAPGPINFTMYLTLFGERLNGTDPEDVIKNAFACMDMDNNGYIPEDTFRHYLTTMGDRFNPDEMDLAIQLAPHDSAGNIMYAKYARAITRGNEEEAE